MDFKNIPTYDECMALVKSKESFIVKREIVDHVHVATFSYRLASYSDFTLPKARNLRGLMFREDTKELLAIPLHKFWNLDENPSSEFSVLKNKKIFRVTEKYDGSLIYFYLLNGVLHAKTKMNCYAEQADWAMDIVNSNPVLKSAIIKAINDKFTPMFELVSPRNQIVILYTKEELRFIGMRSMVDGSYVFENLPGVLPVDYFTMDSLESIVNVVQNYDGHEGFVVTFEDGDMVKIKTNEYYNLHHLRDGVLNENVLVDMILNEKFDDAKKVFSNDPNLSKYIAEIESAVVSKYNHFISVSNDFYVENQDLARKDFAIKAKSELNEICFGLAMSMYVHGKIDEVKFKIRFVNDKLWK